ncbi:TrmH family RNA methyltransferase [Chryseobacterium sp. SORGH_AS909]|uniref:TrmH family RNA methyltransferase n=1 Tax=Chryseobacterium camelliae TaxID=1265445 RepID=A0ABU0TH33_9FLAO|nr:TrmH family RNA methyltransferase [Chryseobacterium camelliae]MDQ1100072.1 TrmH family RNA methyltransferase [Chryseobacterium sp. SORGH_AS_1048]MDR6087416.1 TrmH family RNA methyltransferase [Chryseobacterium sp. SORGH_AS_0909]MDR6131790.1 TrmH family RNA methyltransferase [Chryseobacterium sp. SORGH_AS_1175]MDT3406064.1 TrmH family RNA methyltransferase [Pseudacidovorax intermedius]
MDKKKFRQKYNLFLVEGNKIIAELLDSEFKIKEIFSTDPQKTGRTDIPATHISENELKKISFLKTPKDSVAVCYLNPEKQEEDKDVQLVLDGIQDPGNLGTIIRLADWFGIEQIICSEDTVDFYNPKVIQASMGSFTRVNIVYTDLVNYLSETKNSNIGTDMEGESIYAFEKPGKLNLILGNEGNGMRPETEKLLDKSISIPRFGLSQSTESLNVSMAAGIILGQLYSK